MVPFFSRRSMAAAAVNERLVFFGGVGASGQESILDVADDCWIFDTRLAEWSRVDRHGDWPSPRRCAGFTNLGGRLHLWGGSSVDPAQSPAYTFLNDWWTFDVDARRWSRREASEDHRLAPSGATRPEPRYTPVFMTVGDTFVLFGGYTEDRLGKRKMNDAWLFADGRWSHVPIAGVEGYDERAAWPGRRYGSMSAAGAGTVYVCGGFSDEGDHNDLWRFEVAERRWTLLAADDRGQHAPAARYCAAFAHDADRLFMFGGRSRRYPKANYNDLWQFDLRSARWECLTPNRVPHRYDDRAGYPGYHAKSSVAVAGGEWYLWGGEGVNGHVSDFWRYSFANGEWRMIEPARPDDPVLW
jgi:hypothetical protein